MQETAHTNKVTAYDRHPAVFATVASLFEGWSKRPTVLCVGCGDGSEVRILSPGLAELRGLLASLPRRSRVSTLDEVARHFGLTLPRGGPAR